MFTQENKVLNLSLTGSVGLPVMGITSSATAKFLRIGSSGGLLTEISGGASGDIQLVYSQTGIALSLGSFFGSYTFTQDAILDSVVIEFSDSPNTSSDPNTIYFEGPQSGDYVYEWSLDDVGGFFGGGFSLNLNNIDRAVVSGMILNFDLAILSGATADIKAFARF